MRNNVIITYIIPLHVQNYHDVFQVATQYLFQTTR